jgi:single-strand DNA-binding protein
MSLIPSSFLRSIQPIFIRTVKTSAAGSTKAPETKKKDDENFLGDDIPAENEEKGDAAPSTGRERSLNRIQLIGRVGADPKVGGTQRNKVVTFNLATNEYAGTNTANGEIKQRVDWHRIAIFQPRLLENAEKYIRQGDRLYVQGRLHHNLIRDKETGQDKYVTSIIADDMIFLTKK